MTNTERSGRRKGAVVLLVMQAVIAMLAVFVVHLGGMRSTGCSANCRSELFATIDTAYFWWATLILLASTTLVVVFWRHGTPRRWPPTVGIILTIVGATAAIAATGAAFPTNP
jgi:magnesium-transporting ATPase (P-type)